MALTTNIKSREWPGHPRAATTDDVECLFSVMRDLSGKHFTVRTARYNWRKVCVEFSKHLNPELKCYYHTSSHDRFFEGERVSFDVPGDSKRNPKTPACKKERTTL